MTSLQLIFLGAHILGSLHNYTLPIAMQVVYTMSGIQFQVLKFRYCVLLYIMFWVNYLNLGVVYIPVHGLIVILPLSSAPQ